MVRHWVLLCLSIGAFLPIFGGGKITSKGEVAGEGRIFTDDDQDATTDSGYGAFTRLDVSYRNGPWRSRLRGFGRVDREDPTRDIAAFEEAWIGWRKGRWEAKFGYQMLNWTATEAFHPSDLINSRNLDSNLESPEKLGEAMLSVRRGVGQGALTAYVMPRYEAPNFPDGTSRLSFLPPGQQLLSEAWLESKDSFSSDSYGFQWGLRFTQTTGNADWSLHYLDHLDRQQPVFRVLDQGIQPVYLRTKDIGGTYLHIVGALIVKLEANYRDFIQVQQPELQQQDHGQIAAGLEYGWVYGNGGEGTFLFEAMSVVDVDKATRAGLTPFQRDGLIGYRHAWNDALSRELTITVIADFERSHEYLGNLLYKQRLTDVWSIEASLRFIDAPVDDIQPIGLQGLDESNQIQLKISRFF